MRIWGKKDSAASTRSSLGRARPFGSGLLRPPGFGFLLLDPGPLRLDPQLGPDLVVQGVADLPGMPRLGPPAIDLRVIEVRVLAQDLAEELGFRLGLRTLLLRHGRPSAVADRKSLVHDPHCSPLPLLQPRLGRGDVPTLAGPDPVGPPAPIPQGVQAGAAEVLARPTHRPEPDQHPALLLARLDDRRLPMIRIPFRRLDEDVQRQAEMMEQGLLDRAGLAAPDVDELGLPLPLDREPLQALARPPQRLVQRAQPVERPLGVTGDGPDELSDRPSLAISDQLPRRCSCSRSRSFESASGVIRPHASTPAESPSPSGRSR